jgi:hypothetical protein
MTDREFWDAAFLEAWKTYLAQTPLDSLKSLAGPHLAQRAQAAASAALAARRAVSLDFIAAAPPIGA